ncbi:peptide deformylase [Carboxylicivirga marina]|uniref:Peptide deformylase n=1 Tax=Carboxylicivirga marina TaxID=2800988 RepID=A0ABS1HND8_9BACT|nr:peptide deformylase [Carboxylicivirga marina]MBK3519110.1 peptide deformylase [Carboxylicivirga marina]
MVLPVAVYGHPILRKVAQKVDRLYPNLDSIIRDLWATMYRTDGIGLAAPQVAKSIRVFVIDADVYKDEYPELRGFKRVFINPTLEPLKGPNEWMTEGCLSVPAINKRVKRPMRIQLSYQDENFNSVKEVFEGMTARIIQHEYDHLEGRLFIDHLHPFKRLLLKSKLRALSSGQLNVGYKVIDNY